jgi:hypothetical protein
MLDVRRRLCQAVPPPFYIFSLIIQFHLLLIVLRILSDPNLLFIGVEYFKPLLD